MLRVLLQVIRRWTPRECLVSADATTGPVGWPRLAATGLSVAIVLGPLALRQTNRDQVQWSAPMGDVRLPDVCWVRLATGTDCPACGLTRSWICTVSGRWHEALWYHPLGPWLYAIALLNIPWQASHRGSPRSRARDRVQKIADIVVWLTLFASVTVYLLRGLGWGRPLWQ